MSALLHVDHVHKRFALGGVMSRATIDAVFDANFIIEEDKPEIFTIIGESGSGKTTLARMILGLEAPSEGSIRFKGEPVPSGMWDRSKRDFMATVQPVFQNPFEAFNPLKRVDRYLESTAVTFLGIKQRAKIDAAMDEALVKVGLTLAEVKGRYPHELSGGQLQRCAIARALVCNPQVLIADEPVSMVDASLRMAIVNLLRDLRDQHGVTVIYITHDLATAYYISDRIIIMQKGRVVEMGPARPVLDNPQHPYAKLLKASVLSPGKCRSGRPVARGRPDRGERRDAVQGADVQDGRSARRALGAHALNSSLPGSPGGALIEKDLHQIRLTGGIDHRQRDEARAVRPQRCLACELGLREGRAVDEIGEGRHAVAHLDHEVLRPSGGKAEIEFDAIGREADFRRRRFRHKIGIGMAEMPKRLGQLRIGGKDRVARRPPQRHCRCAQPIEAFEQQRRGGADPGHARHRGAVRTANPDPDHPSCRRTRSTRRRDSRRMSLSCRRCGPARHCWAARRPTGCPRHTRHARASSTAGRCPCQTGPGLAPSTRSSGVPPRAIAP